MINNILEIIENSEICHFDIIQIDKNFTNNQIMNYIDYLIYNIPEYIEDLNKFYKNYGLGNINEKIINIIKDIVDKNKDVFEYINKKYHIRLSSILRYMLNFEKDSIMMIQNGNDNDSLILCICSKNKFKKEYDYLYNNFDENDENKLKLFNMTKNSYFNCIKLENNNKLKLTENAIYINVYI